MMTISRSISTEGIKGYGSKDGRGDPRIEIELEKLNQALADVNFYDGQLFETKGKFRKSLAESRKKLDKLQKSQRKWIDRSKPYYEMKTRLEQLKKKLRSLELQYDRVRLDFQDARDNELAAQRALVNLAASRDASSVTTAGASKGDDASRGKGDEQQGIADLEERVEEDLNDSGSSSDSDEGIVLPDRHMTPSPTSGDASEARPSPYEGLRRQSSRTQVVPPSSDDHQEDHHNTGKDQAAPPNAPPGGTEGNRLSVEDGPQGHDVMENWNKATQKVMEYTKLKSLVAEQIEHKMKQISECQDKMDDLKMTMMKAVERAKPYYQMRDTMEKQFDRKLSEVLQCNERLSAAKDRYQSALAQLDVISCEIEQRKQLDDMRRRGTPGGSVTSTASNLSHFEEIDAVDMADFGDIKSSEESSCAAKNHAELVLSPKPHQSQSQALPTKSPRSTYNDTLLSPASPSDVYDEEGGMHRSMSLMELSTRVWDDEISKPRPQATNPLKPHNSSASLQKNNATVETSPAQEAEPYAHSYPGDDVTPPTHDAESHRDLPDGANHKSSPQYTVSFHMHI